MVRLLEWDDDSSGEDLRLRLDRMRSSCRDLRQELEALTPEAHEVVRDARYELELRLILLQRRIEIASARLG